MTRISTLAFFIFLLAPTELWAGAILAEPRNSVGWQESHERCVRQTRTEKIDVLFLGDSITERWHSAGRLVWRRKLAPLLAANFGIAGDGVQNLLWRVRNGELGGIAPRVLVVLVGTNNLRNNTADEISATHVELVSEIRRRLPKTQVLLLGIFPRADAWSADFRGKIILVNRSLVMLDDSRFIHFLDIGARFRSGEGGVPATIMLDGLHLTEKGYEIWADAMLPALHRLMQVRRSSLRSKQESSSTK